MSGDISEKIKVYQCGPYLCWLCYLRARRNNHLWKSQEIPV